MPRDEPPSSSRRRVGRDQRSAGGGDMDTARPAAVDHQGEVLTAVDLERRITAISDTIEGLTYDLVEKADAAAQALATYRATFAQQRLLARDEEGHGPKGRTTDAEADDRATVACEDLLRDRLVKEAVYGATRDALFAKRAQLEALRSINANVRGQT